MSGGQPWVVHVGTLCRITGSRPCPSVQPHGGRDTPTKMFRRQAVSLQLRIRLQIERMSWGSIPVHPEAHHRGKIQRPMHLLGSLVVAVPAPGCHDQANLPSPQPEGGVVGWADGIADGLENRRLGGTEGISVQHHEAAVTPGLRESNATPQRGVIAAFIRRGGVQADEHDLIRLPAPAPSTPQGVAIAPAWGKLRTGCEPGLITVQLTWGCRHHCCGGCSRVNKARHCRSWSSASRVPSAGNWGRKSLSLAGW